MKATRKVIAALTTLALAVASVPFMVSADDLEVTYNAEASYTVTIPASVTLSATADVTADIKAEDVLLDTGQAISVKLQTASNTASGSTFNAKTADGASTANYTISAGETAIAVGDEVANFDADGSQTLTFSKAEGATAAGSHTETLTFNISVKNAVTTRTVTFNTSTDGTSINKDGVTCSSSFNRYNNLSGYGLEFSVSSGQFTKIEVTAMDTHRTGMDQETMNDIEGWSTTDETATWTGKSSTVPFGRIMGNEQPVTIVFTIEES